eukprot:2588925-Prymnesium_polylepis.3
MSMHARPTARGGLRDGELYPRRVAHLRPIQLYVAVGLWWPPVGPVTRVAHCREAACTRRSAMVRTL